MRERIVEELRRWTRRAFARADRAVHAVYGSRLNPLHQSGTIVVALLVVLLVTGLYLIFFYRIGDPYASMERISRQVWLGRWIRSLHRYAADAAVVAAAVHALRLFAQRRSWGPRALAWISGLALFFLLLVCGWTGYVMVWDVPAQALAVEGARFLDALPLFSEPIGRAFVGEQPLPPAFFFLNLFLHVALPVGMGIGLWVHVSRIARPTLLPPRRLLWATVIGLTGLSLLLPVGLEPPANLFVVPGRVALDVFYAAWLPLTRRIPAGAVWVAGGAVTLGLVLVPLWTRPQAEARPPASAVDRHLCTGCEQCWLDCPYEAIHMAARRDGRADLVAVVDPDLCVSCGICAGSCAPMGVGPPGRTGRDLLREARRWAAEVQPGPGDVVVTGCDRTSAADGSPGEGAPRFLVDCAGSLHTSVVELLVKSGAEGVLIVACPERDCWNREGSRWLRQRLYHDREAELQPRVDRRRLRLVELGAGEGARLREELADFRRELAALRPARPEAVEPDPECAAVAEGGR